jgi:hypothetical protein
MHGIERRAHSLFRKSTAGSINTTRVSKVMGAGKPPKRAPSKPAGKTAPNVVWTFDDGSTFSHSLVDFQRQRRQEAERMTASGDARLILLGRQKLQELDAEAAAGLFERVKQKALRPKQVAGGKASAAARAPAWHARLVAEASRMLKAGCNPRELIGKLMQRSEFSEHSRTTIGRALKKAGVK